MPEPGAMATSLAQPDPRSGYWVSSSPLKHPQMFFPGWTREPEVFLQFSKLQPIKVKAEKASRNRKQRSRNLLMIICAYLACF